MDKNLSDSERILRENIIEPSTDFIEMVKSNLSDVQVTKQMYTYNVTREEAEQTLAEVIAWNLKNS